MGATIKHLKDIDGFTHCGASDGNNYTLCGVALEGERGDTPMTEVHEGIDCPDCIGIILFCKRIRSSEMKLRFERRRAK